MQKYRSNKPKVLRLEQIVPDGQIVNRKWPYNKGYGRSIIDYYLRSGKLESVARGVYRRPGPPLKWQHLFYSLSELGYTHHIGGKSALDLQDYIHHISYGNKQKIISLFGDKKLPSWINEINTDIKFVSFAQKGFVKLPKDSFTTITFGHWDWKLKLSSTELALFELLSLVKEEIDFLIADEYFKSATMLNPKLLNTLLQMCTHIQIKRLFLWFSNRHSHQWSINIDQNNIELGSGKRAVVKGGVLDKRYNITIPKNMK